MNILETVDWRKLLENYISHIVHIDGDSFLSIPSPYLTEQERDFLLNMEDSPHE